MPRKQEDNGSPSEREEAKDDSADSGNEDSSFSQEPESECKRSLVLTSPAGSRGIDQWRV